MKNMINVPKREARLGADYRVKANQTAMVFDYFVASKKIRLTKDP